MKYESNLGVIDLGDTKSAEMKANAMESSELPVRAKAFLLSFVHCVPLFSLFGAWPLGLFCLLHSKVIFGKSPDFQHPSPLSIVGIVLNIVLISSQSDRFLR